MLDACVFGTHLLRRQRLAIHFDGAPQITLFRFHYFEQLSLATLLFSFLESPEAPVLLLGLKLICHYCADQPICVFRPTAIVIRHRGRPQRGQCNNRNPRHKNRTGAPIHARTLSAYCQQLLGSLTRSCPLRQDIDSAKRASIDNVMATAFHLRRSSVVDT